MSKLVLYFFSLQKYQDFFKDNFSMNRSATDADLGQKKGKTEY